MFIKRKVLFFMRKGLFLFNVSCAPTEAVQKVSKSLLHPYTLPKF